MFKAFIIVCAASFSQEIYKDTCFVMRDTRGPYLTLEECRLRTQQMSNEVLNGDLNSIVVQLYRDAGLKLELLYSEGRCTETAGEQV
jgi:hypothetical protein